MLQAHMLWVVGPEAKGGLPPSEFVALLADRTAHAMVRHIGGSGSNQNELVQAQVPMVPQDKEEWEGVRLRQGRPCVFLSVHDSAMNCNGSGLIVPSG